jgi:hypothetical protein
MTPKEYYWEFSKKKGYYWDENLKEKNLRLLSKGLRKSDLKLQRRIKRARERGGSRWMLKRSRDKRAEEDFGFGLYVTPTRSHLFVSFFFLFVCVNGAFSLSLFYMPCAFYFTR